MIIKNVIVENTDKLSNLQGKVRDALAGFDKEFKNNATGNGYY